jgi:hypothetical protein
VSTLSPGEKTWILDLSRSVVERLAPDEMALFPIYSATFERDPDSFDLALTSRTDREALGFAGQEIAEFAVASVVLPVVKELITAIHESRRQKKASTGLVINRDEIEALRRKTYAIACKTLLSGEQAAELSDCIVDQILAHGIPYSTLEPPDSDPQ